jgi:hypothetical protein
MVDRMTELAPDVDSLPDDLTLLALHRRANKE